MCEVVGGFSFCYKEKRIVRYILEEIVVCKGFLLVIYLFCFICISYSFEKIELIVYKIK